MCQDDGDENCLPDIRSLNLGAAKVAVGIGTEIVDAYYDAAKNNEVKGWKEPGAPFAKALAKLLNDHRVGDVTPHGVCSPKARR